MNFPSIDIQGSILSTDLLARIRSEQAAFQQGKDFNADFTNARLKDEISLAWQEAKGQWAICQSKLSRLKAGETGTTETRNFWISPLLTNLGYNLHFSRQSEELNGRSFPIGYRDSSLDNFPVYVGGYHESLDKRPENKQLRVSPHALMQEYLNYSEHLYGIVTNGCQLRLLRDASRITRLSYLEFNLEKLMEEDLYSDFVILYRVLHASRMPQKMDGGGESIIEKYHQQGLEAGSTIRSKLGGAVKGAILRLANGFINHPDNARLRNALAAGQMDLDEYYHHLLRIIYRLLFLFVIEERNLVYADSKAPETKRFNQIYFRYYSLLRLRKLSRKVPPPEATRHYDLWMGLVSTFSLFEKKEIGEKLGIMSLQGDLFGYDAISNDRYDLHRCYLSNAVLLSIIKSLGYFENDSQALMTVNYGGLDVEEFGSVYEGLLELKLKAGHIPGTEQYKFDFDSSNERGRSGSHYTPEELVQPLIKHSLEYLIGDRVNPYRQKKNTKENTVYALLQLKICDIACGSGHILLSAARRVALEIARIQTDEEQPNPLAIRRAMKDVVRNCIYGVDKNPLAVELCKIALWLEAYSPGEPLNFLDHRIKCGDAIVGLAHRNELEDGIADEAFKALPGDDKDTAKAWRDKNAKERKERAAKSLQLHTAFERTTENSVLEAMTEYTAFNRLPETEPEEIARKAWAYKKFIEGKGFTFLKAMSDMQVAQFFIPKTSANKDSLVTDGDFRLLLGGFMGRQDGKTGKATAVAADQRFFHWFLEFPGVFSEGGFDCILGNPPYLGFKKITTNFGPSYNEYIKYIWPEKGKADLITYFFRRIYSLIKDAGFQSAITTNTISQGDTRVVGLDVLVQNGASINFAVRNMKWPGAAAVEVSLVSIFKGIWNNEHILDGKQVEKISTYLNDSPQTRNPEILSISQDCYFQGSVIRGNGFLLSVEESQALLESDANNSAVIKPYVSGDEVNNNYKQQPSRFIIDFRDWDEDKCKKYPLCWQIVEGNVKPDREAILAVSNQVHENKFWVFWDRREKLYESIKNMPEVLSIAMQATKYANFEFVKSSSIFSNSLGIITLSRKYHYAILNSNIHGEWAWSYSSKMKSDLRYSANDVFYTFPFPQHLSMERLQALEEIGGIHHNHRSKLKLDIQLGLTKTYNLLHSNSITRQNIDHKHKYVLALQKHLAMTAGTISFEEAVQGILQLRKLHMQMDNAVLESYGWNDIQPIHDFYEMDYLPENDRIRFTMHPEARKEILKRLLQLNHKIHDEEVKAGMWLKKKTAPKKSIMKSGGEPQYGGLFE